MAESGQEDPHSNHAPSQGDSADPKLLMIVAEALGHPESDRTAFLNKACGADHDLRAKAESLLDSSTEATVMSGSEPPANAPSVLGPEELSGSVAGYELIREIGKGAMGVVYLARDPKLDRQVALKRVQFLSADREKLRNGFCGKCGRSRGFLIRTS